MAGNKGRRILSLAAVLCVGTSSCLAVEDPLGFYVGGGIGRATVRSNDILLTPGFFVASTTHYPFSQSAVGWKFVVGMRPVKLIGVEVEYLDFGDPKVLLTQAIVVSTADSQAHGEALFAVGYLPIPLPVLDIYLKGGPARITQHTNAAFLRPLTCSPDGCGAVLTGDTTRNQTTVAYGAGVQARLGAVAFRLEYERASMHSGDPDLLSLGATWRL